MLKINRFIILSILAFAITSCTEDIDLELNNGYERLVVEGSLTNEAKIHEIKLSKTASYFSELQTQMVSNAEVSITDGTNTFILTENPDKPGIYQTEPDVKGIPGNTYTLNINNAEINNKVENYTATCDMHEIASMDSIQLEHMKKYKLYFVNVYAKDPAATKDYYLFNVYLNGNLYSDTISEQIVQSDDFFNGNYTYGITSQILYDNDVEIGDTITFELAGITREYYNFILELQTESGFSIPLFSGPPANVSTNVSNGGLGFFSVYSVSKASTIVKN